LSILLTDLLGIRQCDVLVLVPVPANPAVYAKVREEVVRVKSADERDGDEQHGSVQSKEQALLSHDLDGNLGDSLGDTRKRDVVLEMSGNEYGKDFELTGRSNER
jgi:hypothetical protein